MAQQGDFSDSYLPLTGDELLLANQEGVTLDLKLSDAWQGFYKKYTFSIGGNTSGHEVLPAEADPNNDYLYVVKSHVDGYWTNINLNPNRNLQVVGSETRVRVNYEAVVALPASTYLIVYELTGL